MRRLLSASILTLSLAMASSAHAEDWFRLNMSSPIHFGAHNVEDGDGAPPDGGVNNNIDIQIDAEVNGRVYGDMTIPVSVSGIDGTYSVTVIGMPSGATWTADTETYGAGSIHWPSATQGTYHPTVEVRDADGALVATSDLEIVVHAPLAASVSQTAYEVEVGGELSIVPDIDNDIGGVHWGSTPSPLPDWLDFNAVTGAIDVDTSAKNTLSDIVLTAVDQDDLTSASTLPFSISVTGATTNYWLSTLGGTSGEEGQGIAVGSDGAVYVTGRTNNELMLAKYTAAGVLSWTKTLGGVGGNYGYGIAVGSDGAVYITGQTSSTGAGNYDLMLAKYTAAGALSWTKTLGGVGADYGQGVAVGSDGAIYVTGQLDRTGAGSYGLMLAKYTAEGALSWAKTLGGTRTENGNGIAVGSDGAVYVTGQTNSAGAGSYDLMLAKYTAAGALSWKTTLGGGSADYGYGIAVGSDGAVYVTGQTNSAGAGSYDLMLAKYTAAGTLSWKKTLGGSKYDYGKGITVGSDGALYVMGQTNSAGAGSYDLMLAKYTAAGTLSWKKTLGGIATDHGYGITVGSDGALYVTGRTDSAGAGGIDLLVARLPADGGADMAAGSFIWQDAVLTVGENPTLIDNQNPTGLTDDQNPIKLTDGQNPIGLTDGQNPTGLTDNTVQFE